MKNMEAIMYRPITKDECNRISEIDASQYIEKAWRKKDGKYQLVRIDYMEESWPDGYEAYRDGLIDTFKGGGAAFGAFDSKGTMIGYVSLNRDIFGDSAKYVLLDSLFISRAYRGKGIGKSLLKLCQQQAKNWGVDKLYTCAGSAEDTIAFYRAAGWIDALEINHELAAEDERDIQLEYDLAQNK